MRLACPPSSAPRTLRVVLEPVNLPELTLAGVAQRVIMELMRHSDMRLTAKVYTDAGMLPTGDAVMKLPALVKGDEPDSQIDSQKLVTDGLLVSGPVQVLETANVAKTLMNRGFEADLSRAVPACPKGEMVRDAGFEPAKRCWLSGTYGCSPTTGPTMLQVA